MERDAIAEWRRALTRREPAYILFAKTSGSALSLPEPPGVGGLARQPFDIRMTRPLAPERVALRGDRSDLSRAIRVLQRQNRLLRAKFGIGWADATNFVLAEADRRGASAAALARALSVRLRGEPAS